MNVHPLTLAILTFVFGVVVDQCSPNPALGQGYTVDEVAAARHCISEASGAQSNDCQVITSINMRNAARRGLTVAEWIAVQHWRHMVNAQRPWIAGLDASMQEPAGWPASVSWDDRGRPAWEATLRVVRRVLNGEIGHGCEATPVVWGGPTPDRARLERMLANGWERVACGVTRNWFLRRSR